RPLTQKRGWRNSRLELTLARGPSHPVRRGRGDRDADFLRTGIAVSRIRPGVCGSVRGLLGVRLSPGGVAVWPHRSDLVHRRAAPLVAAPCASVRLLIPEGGRSGRGVLGRWGRLLEPVAAGGGNWARVGDEWRVGLGSRWCTAIPPSSPRRVAIARTILED